MTYVVYAIPLAIVLSGTFRGFLYEGFEQDGYSSCEASMTMPAQLQLRGGNMSLLPEAAPARFTTRANLAIQLARASSNNGGGKVRYVEWRGRYVGPSYFGTWGLASFGVEIDEVLVAREPRASDCPAINRYAASTPSAFDTAAVIAEAWTRSALVRRLKRAELSVRREFVPDELAISEESVRALRARGVPVLHVIPEPWEPMDRPKFLVSDLWWREDGRVRVVLKGSWWTPIPSGPSGLEDMREYSEQSDTLIMDGGLRGTANGTRGAGRRN